MIKGHILHIMENNHFPSLCEKRETFVSYINDSEYKQTIKVAMFYISRPEKLQENR